SGLMSTRAPVRASRSRDPSSGVTTAWPTRRLAAASMAARVGSSVVRLAASTSVAAAISCSSRADSGSCRTSDKLWQGAQIGQLDLGPRREALARLAGAVDPHGAEPEMRRTRDVPPVGADEADACRRHGQAVDGKTIGPRVGLEDADLFN